MNRLRPRRASVAMAAAGLLLAVVRGLGAEEGNGGIRTGAGDPPAPRLLPGTRGFHFSLYGAPSDPAALRSLTAFLREKQVASAFDPGPAAVAGSRPAFEFLATNGWPVVLYPPDGGRMQLQGGTSVLSAADEDAVRILDGHGVFAAIQLGEWGYHFHRLRPDSGWMKSVLGKDHEALGGRFLRPSGSDGYDTPPRSRREAYDQLREYFLWHRQAKGGRLISVTGHSHYEAYAAEWGASVVGLEVGENIGFTQSKFAFARGASRQWNLPWTVQVSPWFGDAVTTRGPLDTRGGTATGLDAGHSLSLYRRMWSHAWFAGAAMVTPENSYNSFLATEGPDWSLTSHGEAASEAFRFFRSHDRGVPYTPLLVVLDRLAGYNGYQGKTWGTLPRTPADQEVADLLEDQIFSADRRLPSPGNPPNPEARYLNPTRNGELCDVVLSTVTGAFLSRYPVALLAGEVEFGPAFLQELRTAAEVGTRFLLHPRHVAAMPPETWKILQATGKFEALEPATNPRTGRPAAISDARLAALAQALLPVSVTGDPIQFQVNRNAAGWVVELVNNDGVVKTGRTPAQVFPEVVARVRVSPRLPVKSAREWRTGREFPDAKAVELEIPPGETRYVEFR